jgi:hypothetical protein
MELFTIDNFGERQCFGDVDDQIESMREDQVVLGAFLRLVSRACKLEVFGCKIDDRKSLNCRVTNPTTLSRDDQTTQAASEIAIFQVLVSPEVGERDTASHCI